LLLFREGQRPSEVMAPMAKDLKDEELSALGELVAKLPPPPPPARKADAARYARGKALADTERCGSCHGADFSGDKNVPRIAHQREDYLRKALRDYKKGARVGYGNAVMPETVSGLQDAQLRDLAHFLAYTR
jgi:cytochrome c553